jgi:hypothetical protein
MSIGTMSLSELENTAEFRARHIGPSTAEQIDMLKGLGFSKNFLNLLPQRIKSIEPGLGKVITTPLHQQ